MPIPIVAEVFVQGLGKIPYAYTILKSLPWLLLVYSLKVFFNGRSNRSERLMHSKVIMMTGGTSGVGAMVAKQMASRGAQIVLLTQHALSDPFLVDYILDLRAETNNELITAEHVDLSSLHSIRLFATKWVDNAPPRRLDMIILCANTMTPAGGKATMTDDGLESNWAVNYLANFHLLSILSPALRAQPADRDVRIIFGTCSSYMGGSLSHIPEPDANVAPNTNTKKSENSQPARPVAQPLTFSPSIAYATSKFALLTFSNAFQKHLDAYQRPDKMPMNARVINVDPGWTRTPGMRRFLTVGSLWGLLLYLIMWPLWWLVLKSPEQGAQSFLFAAMEAALAKTEGGLLIKECRVVKVMRYEVNDEQLQKALWEESERSVEMLEKEAAVRRALERKEREMLEKSENDTKDAVPVETSPGSAVKQPGSRRSKKAS